MSKKGIIIAFSVFMLIAIALSVLSPVYAEPVAVQSAYDGPTDSMGHHNHYGYGHGYRHDNGANCSDGLDDNNNYQHHHGYMNSTLPDVLHTPSRCPYNATRP